MDITLYSYDDKLWSPCPTMQGNDSFFHSTFGTKTGTDEAYFDKHAQFRRLRWAAFLTYYANETMTPRLENVLAQCLSAIRKYRHASIEDAENLTEYVSDIIAADRNVTIEEIPILATVENVRIVVLCGTEVTINVKPDNDILGSYLVPDVAEEPKEIVLRVDGMNFSRLEPASDESIAKFYDSNTNNNVNINEELPLQRSSGLNQYRKGGSAGSKGVQYQVNIITLVLLNAFKTEEDWKISTENRDAEKFDDVVLECETGDIFIQCKHRENKRITLEELTSANSRTADFSLPKYFLSYLRLKERFNVKNVVICTNTTVHEKTLSYLNRHEVPVDNILYQEDCGYYFCTLNENILPYLNERIRTYLKQNHVNEDIDEFQNNQANLKDFIERLQLFFSYAPINRLKVTVNKLLSGMRYCNDSRDRISFTDLYPKAMDWFQQRNGVYLTEPYAKTMFAEIWRDKYCQRLEQYKITFQRNRFDFHNMERVFHVVCNETSLQTIRIYYALQSYKSKILFVHSDDDVDTQRLAIEAFQFPLYVYLIIICNGTGEFIPVEVYDTLRLHTYKKIILVGNDSVGAEMGWNVQQIDGRVTFEDLSSASQRRLLNKKIVAFQGRSFSLKGLLGTQPIGYYDEVLTSEMLAKAVRGNEIRVGAVVQPLQEEIACYYTPRTFRRQTEDGDETLSEENVYEVRDKFVIIENRGGMGKTTVLKHLAWVIKEKYPHLWVIRVEFNKYTSVLKEFLKKNRDTISLMELLDSQDATKLETEFERHAFSLERKVVLILDGVDEINEDIDPYLGLILGLLEQCREATNIVKVFVASREHAIQTLPEKLNVAPFRLLPFAEDDYVAFFANFWAYKLRLTSSDRDKCCIYSYSRTVVGKMRSWINPDSAPGQRLVVVPLQLKMLAEIFQESGRFDASEEWEGCVEFLNDVKPIPKLPRRINIARLFKTLIEKKGDFLIDERDSSDHKADNQVFIKKYNEYLAYRKML